MRRILFSWREQPGNSTYDRFRWSAFVEPRSLGVAWQGFRDGAWHDLGCDYALHLLRSFRFGVSHYYYDGPNCEYSLGPLHLSLRGNPFTGECDKCWA